MIKNQIKPVNQSSKGQLMALGDFVFELPEAVYQTIERSNTWRHPSSERVGAYPAMQYTGPGLETFSFSGVIYKEFSNPGALDTLREMASVGEAYVMVDATGNVFGQYVIDEVSEKGSYFDTDGTPRKVEFSLKITRADPPADLADGDIDDSSDNEVAQ